MHNKNGWHWHLSAGPFHGSQTQKKEAKSPTNIQLLYNEVRLFCLKNNLIENFKQLPQKLKISKLVNQNLTLCYDSITLILKSQ